jgi:hypothetical protein
MDGDVELPDRWRMKTADTGTYQMVNLRRWVVNWFEPIVAGSRG